MSSWHFKPLYKEFKPSQGIKEVSNEVNDDHNYIKKTTGIFNKFGPKKNWAKTTRGTASEGKAKRLRKSPRKKAGKIESLKGVEGKDPRAPHEVVEHDAWEDYPRNRHRSPWKGQEGRHHQGVVEYEDPRNTWVDDR